MDNAGMVTWSSGAFNFLYITYAGEFNNYGTFDIGDVTANDRERRADEQLRHSRQDGRQRHDPIRTAAL